MNTFSAYIFRQALGPLLAVLGALAAIALLTQGLNQLDIIITNRSAGFAFAWITLLAIPQLVSLILPLAVFFAVLYALHRMHSESEIAVAYGAGVSRGRIARPIIQLAILAAVAHLAINCVVQPWALRERRETIYALRSDIASSLVREGSFTFPAPNLTLYARERGGGGEMRDLMIDDARGESNVTYTARTGAIATVDGAPAIVMRDGQVQRQRDDGTVEVVEFARYVVQLGNFFEESEQMFIKASDRYLYELFFPDKTAHYDQRNVDRFLAEGHSRLSSPLLNITLALIALAGVLTGEFSRRGYARRMMIAAGIALTVRLLALGVQGAAVEDSSLNWLQYALPLIAAAVALLIMGGKRSRKKRLELGPELEARAA
jgi:lipopolysaccharide export system permease protein